MPTIRAPKQLNLLRHALNGVLCRSQQGNRSCKGVSLSGWIRGRQNEIKPLHMARSVEGGECHRVYVKSEAGLASMPHKSGFMPVPWLQRGSFSSKIQTSAFDTVYRVATFNGAVYCRRAFGSKTVGSEISSHRSFPYVSDDKFARPSVVSERS